MTSKTSVTSESPVTPATTRTTAAPRATTEEVGVDAAVGRLTAALPTSAALANEFYDRWMGGPLSYREVSVFAGEYLARTRNTSKLVALSVLNTDDLAARTECVKNLYSEYGNGDAAKAHLVLLEGFLVDLLNRLGGPEITAAELHARRPLESTTVFSDGQRALFTSSDQRVVQGALLAQEWLAYSMLTRLYEGVRNYKACYRSDEEFHEACEYFYVHIGEAEKEHKIQAVTSAGLVCHDAADVEVLREAFDRFVDLTARYWQGVAKEMCACGDG